jgi:hypothetical protein
MGTHIADGSTVASDRNSEETTRLMLAAMEARHAAERDKMALLEKVWTASACF